MSSEAAVLIQKYSFIDQLFVFCICVYYELFSSSFVNAFVSAVNQMAGKC
jgi:hypothetical protein